MKNRDAAEVRSLVRRFAPAGGGGSSAWADITGKPSTFPPEAHTHATSDVTGLDSALSGKQPLATVLTNTTAAFTTAQETKLAGVATGATANATNAELRDRATHTGTQAASTISDFNSASRAQTEAALVAGSGVTITPGSSGATRTLTIAATGGGANNSGHSPFAPATGLFVTNNANATALGTQAQVADRTIIAPFVPGYGFSIDQMGVSVSTLLAASNAKCVIFDTDASGRPTTLLRETANISAAAAATVMSATFTTLALTAGKTYWIGIRASGTFTLRTLAVGALPALNYTNAATPVARQVLIRTETFATGAATWSYASSQHSNALMPLVLMRVA